MNKGSQKLISLLMAVVLLCSLFTACGSTAKNEKNESSVSTTAQKTEQTSEKPVEKTNVDFWYLWGGEDGKRIESLIADYNKSQEKYNVTGLFIADMTKVKVAIAGGTGPDITDDFNGNIASYAEEGILEPLDSYIQRDNVDLSDYISGSIDTCMYNGKTYALPLVTTIFMLYYNKTLLAEAGYAEPPKTDKQLMEMAIKTTKVNADKSINVMGFPEFPFVYFHPKFMFSFGANLFSKDGKFTPDTPESIAALNMARTFRTQFGLDNVLKFNEAGKYCQATDPFITGNQVFRLDGPWLAKIIRKDLNIGSDKLDFGVCPLPYMEEKPTSAPMGEISSSIFYIASNAKNKEGAWDFLKYISAGEWTKKIGMFPALKSLLNDPVFDNEPYYKEFADYARNGAFASPPANAKMVELRKAYEDEVELAATLKKTSEEAMKSAAEKGNKILGK